MAKRKVVQVTLKTMFRLRKEKSGKYIKIATIDELKKIQFRERFGVGRG